MNASEDRCRILLCEDSVTYATALTRFLENDPDLRVVARCETGEEAAAAVARLAPDLVIMDIELPGIDGVEATRQIMESRPLPVLVLSSRTRRGSQLALGALAAGALDVRSKEDVTFGDAVGARAVAFRRYLKRLARLSIADPDAGSRRPGAQRAPERERSAAVVGMAASTGGPAALRVVLGSLPADYSIPVVVVQHIAAGFVDALVDWLDDEVAIAVRHVRRDVPLSEGAWIAPDDAHVMVDEELLVRLDTEVVSGYPRPAADFLFVSMASAVGADAVAVVLAGMGNDGADGIAAVRRAGGLTIAQAEAPGSTDWAPGAEQLGAEEALPLAEVGPALSGLPPVNSGDPP